MAPTLDPAGNLLPVVATEADVARLLELNRAIRRADRPGLAVDEQEETQARLDAARSASQHVLNQYLPTASRARKETPQ
ncbi:hypothetical protein ACFZDG_35640 [Kitasatospora xanthocidica]|uniref:hypothetical protein n=1 Tax=Kitasatospora xanthocidica TaxID=83382 RepID=UPI0036E376A8